MAEERGTFNIPIADNKFGITSTRYKEVERGESFLDSDPDDIKLLEEEAEDDEVIAIKPAKKTSPKPQVKTNQFENKEESEPEVRQLSEDDFFAAIDEENSKDPKNKTGKEPEEKSEEAITPPQAKKKPELEKKVEANPQEEDPNLEEDETDTYSAIAEEMVKQGIFEAEQDEKGNPVALTISSPEEFLERFQHASRRIASEYLENYLDSKGPEARDIFDNIIANGVDPQEYINRYAKIQDFKTLDLTNEDNQEKVVRELYRSEGRSTEYIERKIAQHRQNVEMQFEAEEAQKILVKKEEEATVRIAAEKKAEEGRKAVVQQQYVQSLTRILNDKAKAKEFDGIEVNNKIAVDTFNYLTQNRYKIEGSNQLLTEFDKDIRDLERPENHEMKVKLALLIQMLRIDPKLSKIGKTAVSKEASTLFTSLKKRNNRASGGKETKVETKNQDKDSDNGNKSWFS